MQVDILVVVPVGVSVQAMIDTGKIIITHKP
jgi:hypothetical protein